MGALPVTLIVVSAFMHAAWNLLARRNGGAQACIWRMLVSIVALGAVPALVSLLAYPCVSMRAMLCLLGSGASCGFYYVCLARGYESGEFTSVYPAARALPVLLVGIGDALRGHPPSRLGWLGMFLVAMGCLLVPLTSLSDFRLRHYWKRANLWIVLTAMGTVGYSLFDKIGTEAIPRGPRETAVYCYLFFAVAAITYVPLKVLVTRPTGDRPTVGWRVPVIAGVLCFVAYWLVLCAYQMTGRASYVVAFRQFSIVIGVMAAFVFLNESGKAVRFAGSIVITAGLVLLKVFGGQ